MPPNVMTFRLSKSSTEAFREHFPCSLFSILGDFNTRICGFVAAFQFSNLEIDVLAFPFPNKKIVEKQPYVATLKRKR